MIDVAQAGFVGSGLVRPECVLATAAGFLYTADWRGGVVRIRPDGRQDLYAGATADLPEGLRPNGIALEPGGSFLFAQLGLESGGIWRLDRAGQVSPVLTELDGRAVPPSNYVVRDPAGRLWATVSTRVSPRVRDFHAGASSGFVLLRDGRGARIVADGLGFANECLPDPEGRFLYVNETYGRRLSRFAIRQDGDLGPQQLVATFGPGTFPDGLTFDGAGDIWITSIVSNQILRVSARTGSVTVEAADRDEAHVARVEAAYGARALTRALMDTRGNTRWANISSLAFGGPDLRTGYLGCLLDDRIATVRMPVAGAPPVHWLYDGPSPTRR